MKKIVLTSLLIIALAITTTTNAQVGVGVSTANIHPSAQLDVTSTTKGFLPLRLNEAERDLIPITRASAGLTICGTNCGVRRQLEVYDGESWTNMMGVADKKGL